MSYVHRGNSYGHQAEDLGLNSLGGYRKHRQLGKICPRCSGSLRRQREDGTWAAYCLECGRAIQAVRSRARRREKRR